MVSESGKNWYKSMVPINNANMKKKLNISRAMSSVKMFATQRRTDGRSDTSHFIDPHDTHMGRKNNL